MKNLRRKWEYYTEEKTWNDTIQAKDLGITYDKSVPQTIADQTWYFNCKNVPEELPNGWSVLKGDLEQFIGHGLSWQDVKELKQEIESYENQVFKTN